jgi:hypothetical protein
VGRNCFGIVSAGGALVAMSHWSALLALQALQTEPPIIQITWHNKKKRIPSYKSGANGLQGIVLCSTSLHRPSVPQCAATVMPPAATP